MLFTTISFVYKLMSPNCFTMSKTTMRRLAGASLQGGKARTRFIDIYGPYFKGIGCTIWGELSGDTCRNNGTNQRSIVVIQCSQVLRKALSAPRALDASQTMPSGLGDRNDFCRKAKINVASWVLLEYLRSCVLLR